MPSFSVNIFLALFVLLCTACLVCTAADPVAEPKYAQILAYENYNDGTGNYNFRYETSDGSTREETGYLANPGTPDEHLVVKGSYSYIDTNGKRVLVRYIADKDGYRVLPDLPPVAEIPPLGISGAAIGTLVGGGLG